MEDWGLQAMIGATEYDDFGSVDIKKEYDQALIFSFPHLFDDHHLHESTSSTMESVVVGNELDQLYKPFYPVFEHPPPPDHIQTLHQEVKQEQEQEMIKKTFCGSPSNSPQLHASKLKKSRKNLQKKVVVQVTADGLSSDLWAWRKYGQKPIKGSPYPRSYYRCSSSKGCLARRQVEQSCTDPGTYLLTYTAEHNHPQPTRRNSLAGINRSKFRATPKSPTISDGCKTVAISKDSPIHSPTTPSLSSIDEEVLQQTNPIKQERMNYNEFDNQEIKMVGGFDDNDFLMPEMVFSDDFFEGLGDLSEFNSESSYNCSNKQFSHVRC